MIGKTILHYAITRKLGSGAMGQVYLAEDTRTERRVALKFLGHSEGDADARARLFREAQAAARLSHTNIVTLFGIEEADGDVFLVEEYVEGETLAHRLSRGPLGPEQAGRLARELTAALVHAHQHGVLHRDLKPENILVTADGHFKIADFGIARIHGTPTLTSAGTLLGTLAYLAPERLEGNPGNERSDLFALGAILYEALCGTRAFRGQTEAEVLYAIMTQEPAALTGTGPIVAPLAQLAARLLAKDPHARPASAEVVAGMLDGLETASRLALPRPRRRWVPIAAAAVAIAGAGVAWRGHVTFTSAAEANNPSVAVLYFQNVAEPSDRDRLGPITGNLLLSSLAQARQLNVLSTETILDAMHRMGASGTSADHSNALKIAEHAHAQRLVTGTILQTSPQIVMTAEVSDVRTGRVLDAARIEGEPGQTVFEVVDALSTRLLSHMVRGGTPAVEPVAQRSSSDLAAYRAYVAGIEQLSRGDLDKATASFSDATRRDSTFAEAYYQLAITQWWGEKEGAATANIEQARRYASRLTPAESAMLDGLALLVGGRFSEAIAPFERLAVRYPKDKMVLYGLLEATFHGGETTAGIDAARRILAIDPDFMLAAVHLCDGLGYTGHGREAESMARDYLRRDPRNMFLWYSLFNITLFDGRPAAALAVAREAEAAGVTHPFLSMSAGQVACSLDSAATALHWFVRPDMPAWQREDGRLGVAFKLAMVHGRFHDAEGIAERAWAALPDSAVRANLDPVAYGIPAAIAIGDAAHALAWADTMEARSSRSRGTSGALQAQIDRGQYDIELGHLADARVALRTAESMPGPRTEASSLMLRAAEAQLEAAEGRPRQALVTFARADWRAQGFLRFNSSRLTRIRFEMAAGLYDAANAQLDSVIAAPIVRLDDAGRLYYYKGQILEKLGRRTEAVTAYRRFLDAWKTADADRPEITAARDALRRLAPS